MSVPWLSPAHGISSRPWAGGVGSSPKRNPGTAFRGPVGVRCRPLVSGRCGESRVPAATVLTNVVLLVFFVAESQSRCYFFPADEHLSFPDFRQLPPGVNLHGFAR